MNKQNYIVMIKAEREGYIYVKAVSKKEALYIAEKETDKTEKNIHWLEDKSDKEFHDAHLMD